MPTLIDDEEEEEERYQIMRCPSEPIEPRVPRFLPHLFCRPLSVGRKNNWPANRWPREKVPGNRVWEQRKRFGEVFTNSFGFPLVCCFVLICLACRLQGCRLFGRSERERSPEDRGRRTLGDSQLDYSAEQLAALSVENGVWPKLRSRQRERERERAAKHSILTKTS